MEDYYDTLQIPRTASSQEIKKAYYKLAHLYHPDKNPSSSAAEKFRQINIAYRILSDTYSKALYDDLANPKAESYQEETYTTRTQNYPAQDFKNEPVSFLEMIKTMFLVNPKAFFIFAFGFGGIIFFKSSTSSAGNSTDALLTPFFRTLT